MIVKFRTNVPVWERFRILWYGRIYVRADYRGQFKPLKIELGAIPKGKDDASEN